MRMLLDTHVFLWWITDNPLYRLFQDHVTGLTPICHFCPVNRQ